MTVERSERAKELTRSRYIGKEFEQFRKEVESFLQNQFSDDEFNNFKESGQGVMLIHLFSFVADSLSFYLDRQADETYLETARLRNSVARLTRQTQYKMDGATPASGDVEIKLNETLQDRLIISSGTKIQGPGGLIYTLGEDVSFDPGETGPKTGFARQAVPQSDSFVSSGEENQDFRLNKVPANRFVVDGTIRVFVNQEEWESVKFMRFEQENIFEPNPNFQPAEIQFGDGIAGNIPEEDASIEVDYEITAGADGNVSQNELTEFIDPIQLNGTSVDVSITNPQPTGGGDDPESLKEAKTRAPNVTFTGGNAVLKQDYASRVRGFRSDKFGKVAEATAVTSRSFEGDKKLQTLLNNIRKAGQVEDELRDISVQNSSASSNNQDYRAVDPDASYDSNNDKTTIFVVEDIPSDTVDGEVVVGGETFTITDINQSAREFVVDGNAIDELENNQLPNINNVLDDIEDYWSRVVSDGCKANVVNVVILSEDDEGRLVPSSTGLAEEVEEMLQEFKESTVDVAVVDGKSKIRFLDINIEVEIKDRFDRISVVENVRERVKGYVADFRFGESPRISDLYEVIENTEGVIWSHASYGKVTKDDPITGDTIDVTGSIKNNEGDVVLESLEIATLNSISVSSKS